MDICKRLSLPFFVIGIFFCFNFVFLGPSYSQWHPSYLYYPNSYPQKTISPTLSEYDSVDKDLVGIKVPIEKGDLWYEFEGKRYDLSKIIATDEVAVIWETSIEKSDSGFDFVWNYFKEKFGEPVRQHSLRYDIWIYQIEKGSQFDCGGSVNVFLNLIHQLNLEILEKINESAEESEFFDCVLSPIFYFPDEGASVLTHNLIVKINTDKEIKFEDGDLERIKDFVEDERIEKYSMKMIAETVSDEGDSDKLIIARATRESDYNIFDLVRLFINTPTIEEVVGNSECEIEDIYNIFEEQDKNIFTVVPELERVPGLLDAKASIEAPKTESFVGGTWTYVIRFEGEADMILLGDIFKPGSSNMKEFVNKKFSFKTLRVGKPEIIMVPRVPEDEFKRIVIIKIPMRFLRAGYHKLPGLDVWYIFKNNADKITTRNYKKQAFTVSTNEVSFHIPELASPDMKNVFSPMTERFDTQTVFNWWQWFIYVGIFMLVVAVFGCVFWFWRDFATRKPVEKEDSLNDVLDRIKVEFEKKVDSALCIDSAKDVLGAAIEKVKANSLLVGSNDLLKKIASWQDLLVRPNISVRKIKEQFLSDLDELE